VIKVGLDYHTKTSYVSILSESGEEIHHARLDSQTELPEFFREAPDAQVLFEAGYGWPRLEKILEGCGVELVMCHPHANRRIATDRRKSDHRDARHLAVCLKTGAYKRVYMPDTEVRDQRQLVRGRTDLVQTITGIKNRIHSVLAYAGVPKESVNIFAAMRRAYLETVEVPEETREVLDALVEMLDVHNEVLKRMNERIGDMNRRDHRARLLKTIPGVGDITARILLAEIGEVKRFKTAKSLACYVGLTPGQRQSGEKMCTTGITKEGSTHIRWVMVEAAWRAVRRDPRMREVYERLRERKSKSQAICAVARKMTEIVWHILTGEVPYRPQKAQAEGKPAGGRGTPDAVPR